MNVTKHTKYIWQIDNFLPDDEIDYFLNAVGFYNPTVKADFRNCLLYTSPSPRDS